MEDRTPKYPGRIKLTPVPGQADTYDMIRADEATQAGTPMNKATFLKDTTAALFEMGADAVPDEIFQKIRAIFNDVDVDINGLNNSIITLERAKAQVYVGSYVGTGTYGESSPNTLTFPFKASVVWNTSISNDLYAFDNKNYWWSDTSATMSEAWSYGRGPCQDRDMRSKYGGACKISNGGKTWTWYSKTSAYAQANNTGETYKYIALGKL